MSDCVWYVAYGSNLSAERFALYLAKSADTTAPSGSRPLRIPHPVVFSGESKRWSGGGVAFLDLDTEAASASYCRAWRITTSQFEDVFRQENGRSDLVPLPVESVTVGTSRLVLDSWYGRLHRFADIDGEPAVTFTRATRPAPLNPAHQSYLDVISIGLAETWGLTSAQAVAYLHSCPGNEPLLPPDA